MLKQTVISGKDGLYGRKKYTLNPEQYRATEREGGEKSVL